MIRVLVLVALTCGVATAAPTPESTRLNAEGQQLFRAGRYLESIPSFEKAYAIDPDPAYVFDIAQAYRLAHSCAKAVEYYDRFFAEVPDPPNAEKIRGFRDASEACAKEQNPEPPKAVPMDPPPIPVVAPRHDEPAVDRGSSLRIAGLGTIAGGVVAAGIGVVFSMKVRSLQQDRHDLCPSDCLWTAAVASQAKDLDESGHSAQTTSAIAYSVAGVAVVGGVVLYMIGRSKRTEPTIVIAPQPGGAAFFAGLAF